jgi:hypothetical protein
MFLQKLALFVAVMSATAATARSEGGKETSQAENIVLENEYVTCLIGADGGNLSFRAKQSGKEYGVQKSRRHFLTLKKGGKWHEPTGCSAADGNISVEFKPLDTTVVVKATCKKHYFVFEIESVGNPDIEAISLLNLAVTSCTYVSNMSGVATDEEFAACARALNLQVQTNVSGRPAVLAGLADRKYGLAGAKVALVGCPGGRIRAVLKEMVRNEGLPYSRLGGPWAIEVEENRGSYVFAYVSEHNVDDWIALAKKAGITHIHLNGWYRSRGHYEPRKGPFPNGLAGLKATVDKIHAAGLKAGMHTLTGCISPGDPWVTPVPDKRLAVDASFTLAEPIDGKGATVLTKEQPLEFDTVWASESHGNVIRIGDELIQYSGLSRQPPYGFTGCKRGAFGTKVAAHAKGAAVGHLFVRYRAFQPDENSTLVDDVAAAIAGVFNTCGFDMIYMDGAEGMSGGWRGVAKMRAAIFKKLDRPALVEASSWGQHSWPFHSRIGAWDYPNWAIKRFIDVHCRSVRRHREGSLLPSQLGWWSIFGPNQNRNAQLPDEIEYLCCKSLGYDAPMSFQGVRPGGRPANARQDEYLTMIGRYERLRLAGYFPESVREKLRGEQEEFHLVRTPQGDWQLVPTDYAVHKVTGRDDDSDTGGSDTWTVTNRYAGQPVKLRIQALFGVEPYDSPESLVLADFAREDEFAVREAAGGVAFELGVSREQVKVGNLSGRYSAKSTSGSRRGAWAKAGKVFSPEIDLGKCDALGVWVHGDGKGELLNFQLNSPRQYYRAISDHYVKVDFSGWRYFELLLRERDAAGHDDYAWPYKHVYAAYRAPLVCKHVSSLDLYFNNLPPRQSVTCLLSPIKALRTRKLKLDNPSITIRGERIVFPVSLESGCYLEFTPASECKLYDRRGELLREVRLEGRVPTLAPGENEVKFTCETSKDCRPRAKVTVISHGKPLQGSRSTRPTGLSGAPLRYAPATHRDPKLCPFL